MQLIDAKLEEDALIEREFHSPTRASDGGEPDEY